MALPRSPTGVLFENDEIEKNDEKTTETHSEEPQKNYKMEIVWLNFTYILFLNIAAMYAIYLVFTSAKIATTIYGKLAICYFWIFFQATLIDMYYECQKKNRILSSWQYLRATNF